eukprot:TRINITY_DN6398_c0_g1_i3.p2 TRINITY_DN6398_c0_g1~~TRINITY_DN6398_c0_g1_i3.p2  ORF type:complete len:382 (+),score=91.12 TRINITY_DN6398_c0_g1_i3:357-1502(+)
MNSIPSQIDMLPSQSRDDNKYSSESEINSPNVEKLGQKEIIPGKVFTPNEIRSIFKKNPEVLKAYKNQVPHILTENDFWKKYMISDYFIPKPPEEPYPVVEDSQEETFPRWNGSARDSKNAPSRIKRQRLLSAFNKNSGSLMTSILGGNPQKDKEELEEKDDPKLGEFDPNKRRKSEEPITNIIIDNENQYSMEDSDETTVEETTHLISFNQDIIDSDTERIRKRLLSSVTISDLVQDTATENDQFSVNTVRQYYSSRMSGITIIPKNLVSVKSIKQWKPSNVPIDQSSMAASIMNELFPPKSGPSLEDVRPIPEVQHDIETYVELLRHYWSAKLSKNSAKEERLNNNINTMIQKFSKHADYDDTLSSIVSTVFHSGTKTL